MICSGKNGIRINLVLIPSRYTSRSKCEMVSRQISIAINFFFSLPLKRRLLFLVK